MDNFYWLAIYVFIAVAFRYLHQWVSTKVADSRYEQAVEAVFSAVEYVNQTFVDYLKESETFDREAQSIAFIKAKSAALEAMEKSTIRWLEKSFDDVDAWLEVQIESAVKAVK